MMKDYIFFFGKNKELSLLELISYLIKTGTKYHLVKFTEDYAIVTLDCNPRKAISELGGILKIAEYFDLNNIEITKNKVLYGVSFFYEDYKILDELKTLFKKEKVRAFLKKPRKGIVFAPKEAKKLDFEFIVFKKKIAKVIVNSEPSKFKERDEKRPYFDKLKVTSLRLSKILINLSQIRNGELLLDPFAGAGSILQEAMIMGINVVGTDIDSKSVDGTINNLNWIKNKYGIKSKFTIYNIDNKDVDSVIDKVDGVVTEPYFGPFFKTIPKYEDIVKLAKDVEKIYFNLFVKLKNIVKKNGLIVFPVPVYKTSNGRIKVNFEEIITKTGFKIYSPLKEIKMPIKYSLKGSIIEREIYILQN